LVRRLVAKSREDEYASRRDYQTIHAARGQRFEIQADQQSAATLVLTSDLLPGVANTPYVAFGGYVSPSDAIDLQVELESDDGASHSSTALLPPEWTRVGAVIEAPDATHARVSLSWPAEATLDVWGLAIDPVDLPGGVAEIVKSVGTLRQMHLVPETFYLPHESAVALDIDEAASGGLIVSPGREISLKKCSYCGRQLPLDMARLGLLAFHKHNAKRTRHQNECRACKAWRINSHFNPLRTNDQHHESSTITRERKLLLREPEILQALKDRSGAGLKSQIWEHFERRCFKCDAELELSEVQLDHTRPLAYLWPIDEHATCLCAVCNNAKKEKFPVEFYNDAELVQLSRLTGLSLEELKTKSLNETELNRILADLPGFATQWEPRTFAATARKIKELRAEIDLFPLLEQADPDVYLDLQERLADRPPAVPDA
jgi:hypothetical protein